MTSQIKAKLLQHFAAKKSNKGGFTLIELLVVIIIIGILSAIALPSFLNQANKAKQSEAKTYIGSMNRAQQAYYMENGTMATNARFAQLGLGIKTQTDSYNYAINDGTPDATTGSIPFAGATAAPRDQALKLYAGGAKVATIGTDANIEATTLTTLCEALLPAAAPVADGGYTGAAAEDRFSAYLSNVDATANTTPACGAKMKEL